MVKFNTSSASFHFKWFNAWWPFSRPVDVSWCACGNQSRDTRKFNRIDRMHKWRPTKYCVVFVLIRPTSLVLKEHFFCILSVPTRLVSLISTKTKEYFFGRHLCIRSMLSKDRPLKSNFVVIPAWHCFVKPLPLQHGCS